MNIRSLLFIVAFFMSASLISQTEVGGGIFTNTTWVKADSPYEVVSDIVIFPDQTLTIEPGVEIRFRPGTQLENRDGNLVAIGTRDEQILFSVTDTTEKWKGIFNNNLEAGSPVLSFEYIIVEYAETGINFGAENSYRTIVGATFRNNDRGVYDGGQGYHWIQLYSCSFLSNTIGMEGRMSVWDSFFSENETGFANPLSFLNSSEGGRVVNCRFDNNGIAVGVTDSPMTFAYVKNSVFTNNERGIYLYWAEIDSSSFEFSTDIAIQFYKGYLKNSFVYENFKGVMADINTYQLEITNNDISANEYGLVVAGSGALIEENVICSNTEYNAYLETNQSVNLGNNCWCTEDEAEIQEKIYDAYDNTDLGIVTYTPFDISCIAPVFPGDVNRDGLVSVIDLLLIGLKMGESGPAREHQGTTWWGLTASDWSETFIHGMNLKYADTNGDGVIDEKDMDALQNNYSMNHVHVLDEELPFSDHPMTELLLSTRQFDSEFLELNLENIGEFENMRGMAFSLVFDSPIVGKDNITVSTEESWWSPDMQSLLSMHSSSQEGNRLDIAMVKKADAAIIGSGNLCSIRVELPAPMEVIGIEFENIVVIDNEGRRIETNGIPYLETITFVQTMAEQASYDIFPNPASSQISIRVDSDYSEIIIRSINGQEVKREVFANTIDISDLQPGIYVVTLSGDQGLVSEKFIKQ
jgi:hypothetical protein